MKNKIIIDGEELDQPLLLRVTVTTKDHLISESLEKNTSMNLIANKILSRWGKQRQAKRLKQKPN